jgi:two-component system, sensor histidine kinase ChiS
MDPRHIAVGTDSPLTEDSGAPADGDDDVAQLQSRLAELQRERDHLAAAVDILQSISGTLHFAEILAGIARSLGDYLRLDRCAIFLLSESGELRLVASYEDPSIRNLVVDINRYPELKRAFATGEAVFIPDVANDPTLAAVKHQLAQRRVRSIVVVPMRWQGTIIGALFLRTTRDALLFTDADVRFCELVASLTAKALRNAHQFETLMQKQQEASKDHHRSDLQRIALLAFLRRLLQRYGRTGNDEVEALLPKGADEELDRLVGVALHVFEAEARGEST